MTPIGLALLAAAAVVVVPRRTSARPFAAAETSPVGSPSAAQLGRLTELLDRADLEIDPGRVPSLWGSFVGVAAFMGVVLAGVVGAIGGAVIAAVGPPAWVALRGDRRRARVISSLPELLELVARGLRGGADLRTSIREAAGAVPGAGETLRPVLDRVQAGGRLGEALDRWVLDLDHPDAAIVRSVLRLGDTTGAAMAAALDRAAGTLRDRAALRDEISALTAQTRASSMVVALAPVGFLLVVTSTDPRSAEVLFTTTWGRLSLGAGLALDAAGIGWMRRLTDRVGG